jgi:Tfp pilus assembly protein PilX
MQNSGSEKVGGKKKIYGCDASVGKKVIKRGSAGKSVKRVGVSAGAPDGKKKGVSLIIAIVLISIIVLFSLAVSNLVTASIRQSANVNRANEAFYAAEGALEAGLMANQSQGAGYSASQEVSYCTTGTCPTGTVMIQGQVPSGKTISEMYVVPTPGSGTVGSNCDPLKAVTTGKFVYGKNKDTGEDLLADAIDNPCNWNKIKVGETVGIPLYVTTTDSASNCPEFPANSGTYICNPTDLGLTSLIIKVRTPCTDGNEYCDYLGRYSFDTMNGDEVFKCIAGQRTHLCGDTIVSWQISGANIKGDKTYTMVPNDWFNNNINDARKNKRKIVNSEIYESLINDARTNNVIASGITDWTCGSFCVLYADSTGNRKGKDLSKNDDPSTNQYSILDFLKNTGSYATERSTDDDKINMPVLKMSVVHSLTSSENTNIPYLEYQIVSDMGTGTIAPAASAQTITAEGLSGEFKQVLEVKLPQQTGLLEYVIQQ